MDTLLIFSVVMLTTVFFISDVGGVSLNAPAIRQQYKDTKKAIMKERKKNLKNANIKRRMDQRVTADDGTQPGVAGQKSVDEVAAATAEANAELDRPTEQKRQSEEQAKKIRERARGQMRLQHRPQDKYKREWNTHEKDAL
ncbi:uncharacterized protein LOC128222847 [Mya arenaria]|uniref:uncharacterized protein LOC128222847 n=1 Tax=Mya arenaria TaxID=6604 RepID=UPI0022E81BB6|nr:uncharacterized protein LOC128222847 [Mya arenaria]